MNEDKGTAIDRWEKRQPENQVLAPVPSTAEIMMTAVRNGLGKEQLEVLERMFELDIRSKERQAKEAYYKAMAWWASDAPVIIKDKEVSYKAGGGTTAYKHAGLGNVTQAINTSMSQYGLHASWLTTQPEGKITVTCTISHELGHSESTSLTADADTSGSKNPIQAIGSTVSYLERYTILALTGLATHEQDTDGVTSEPQEAINDQMFADLTSLISEVKANEGQFCKFLKIESLDKMPAAMYARAVKELQRKKK